MYLKVMNGTEENLPPAFYVLYICARSEELHQAC